MHRVCRALGALLLICVSLHVVAFEEGFYPTLDAVGTGSLLLRKEQGYQPFVRSEAEFDLQVSGLVSRVTLRQTFINPSREWVEAVYVLPLPEDSAVNAMRILIGERVIEGEIQEKQEAQRIYTQAKAEGKRAGLLQQQRPNLFSTQVANIGPRERVAVELTFLQTLHYQSGEFSLRLPMTLTPRYIPGKVLEEPSEHVTEHTGHQDVQGWAFPTTQVPDANRIAPPQTHGTAADHLQARLHIKINPGFEVESFSAPYHSIRTARLSNQYQISTDQQQVVMDRDFVLSWKPVASQAPVAAYFSEPVDGKEHGLIMLMPPAASPSLQIGPRELILIIDSSGSMSGQSMAQAKQAVQLALSRLRPQDRFNVIDFDSEYRTLFPGSAYATQGALRRASFFVDGLVADGGTEMYAPLQAALTQSGTDASEITVTQVVFITDGSVGNESTLFELIHQQIGAKRLYTVGIGSAPNAYFMRKAAEFGRGTYTYIGSTGEVQTKMAELFGRIEKPALTQISVAVNGAVNGVAAELYPQPIPDLFLGEPLLIKARFGQPPTDIVIQGRFEGQPWRRELSLRGSEQGEGAATGIATLWARAKVASLQDDGVRQGNASLHKADIIALGIEHRLATQYTSFVAVDNTPVRSQEVALKQKQLANAMPFGSMQSASSVAYPRTALGLRWHMLIGLLLFGGALLLWLHNEFGGAHDADLA